MNPSHYNTQLPYDAFGGIHDPINPLNNIPKLIRTPRYLNWHAPMIKDVIADGVVFIAWEPFDHSKKSVRKKLMAKL